MSSVAITYSDSLSRFCCLSPKYGDRYALVMELIKAYNLTAKIDEIPPLEFESLKAELECLSEFHSSDYLEALLLLDKLYSDDDDPVLSTEEDRIVEEFGLVYDCHGFTGVYGYALAGVRSTLAAVDALISGKHRVAINWSGGWHHAKRSQASGFCYLNDVVLALQRLTVSSSLGGPDRRVLYIDLDLHHGDAVEEAFCYSRRVVTFSVHHGSLGFFPGTGVPRQDCEQSANTSSFFTGARLGEWSCFNLPLDEGIDDMSWFSVVKPVLSALHVYVAPSVVVVQCGADCLSSDPHRIFNLSATQDSGYVLALREVLSWDLPCLILGGGGYNFADSARLWTLLTATIVSVVRAESLTLEQDIPFHSQICRYGPDFTLDLPRSLRQNKNNLSDLKQHVKRLTNQAYIFAKRNSIVI